MRSVNLINAKTDHDVRGQCMQLEYKRQTFHVSRIASDLTRKACAPIAPSAIEDAPINPDVFSHIVLMTITESCAVYNS